MTDQTIKFIRTSRNDLIWLDPEDYEGARKKIWHRNNHGYFKSGRGESERLLHVLICKPPIGMEADHKNGQKNDCRRRNLRPCTHTQNIANGKMRINNTSGYKGVSKVASGRYAARVCTNYVNRNLGTFDTPEEAARAYDQAAKEAFGEFARLNFSEARLI